MFDLSPLMLGDSPLVIDCGANEGRFLDCLFQQVRTPRVIAIEMLPDLARQCKARHPGVTMLNCAVGTMDATARYHRYRASVLSSVLEANEECAKHCGQNEAEQISVDYAHMFCLNTIAAVLMIESVDLLKVDVQGLEMQVLSGASVILPRVQNVIAEVGFIQLYEDQPLAPEFDHFMLNQGFQKRWDLFTHIAKSGAKTGADRWYSR